jgi:hypothetical protein
MRGIPAVALVLAIGACGAPSQRTDQSSGSEFLARSGVVLSGEAARAVLQQCSRAAPMEISGYWMPSPADIHELDARLPAVLDSALATVNESPGARRASQYYRQYVGLVRQGRKVIYVNGFHGAFAKRIDHGGGPVGRMRPAWRRYPVVICDGGPGLFGVVFDVQDKTFDRLQFNGALAP